MCAENDEQDVKGRDTNVPNQLCKCVIFVTICFVAHQRAGLRREVHRIRPGYGAFADIISTCGRINRQILFEVGRFTLYCIVYMWCVLQSKNAT